MFLRCYLGLLNIVFFFVGYDFMGYEMFKFDFRVELEVDLKLICEGKKDKFVVLRQQVQKYKQVFIEVVVKAKK